MKFRTEVPFFIQFPPSCHPEQREGSVTTLKNIFSQELQPNFFILRKSELSVQLKHFFIIHIYWLKQEECSNNSSSKRQVICIKTPWRFTQNMKTFF